MIQDDVGVERRAKYIPVKQKFAISHGVALFWLVFSIAVSYPWVLEFGKLVTLPIALFVIAGIAYIPGYMNAFMVSSLLFDRQPPFRIENPKEPITILIACYNEENKIGETLRYIKQQSYEGDIRIIVIDNNSSDKTFEVAKQIGEELGLMVTVISEPKPGKNYALNSGLTQVETNLFITLDADTLLHQEAVKYIVRRKLSAPEDVCAVAGAVLVRNSRGNLLAKIQEWDYFIGIASIKRLQGLFQGTLVAQGAFSLYTTDSVKLAGGWPDAIGEDIVLTWKLLENKQKVYFEPLAVAFTEVPEKVDHFFRQRSRWARGMIEALKVVKPWQHKNIYTRYLTSSNLLMPYLDLMYTFFWIPGLLLALLGYYWLAGIMTILVLPLALLINYILYSYQKNVFKVLKLRIRKNIIGLIAYILIYQIIMSPTSVYGYFQEFFKLRRVWR
ncbi:glycosyltransferase family 2 protein [Alkalihalophilus marmarensis]|uniref:Biofilm PGA synthesis N-glycosyltransferase PgaC n=1 Tax=Alkalihalophilus marmarensis DSM 21297 TaxID=1188261 RepID=U6SN59_9BACI|nr:glycosyltransferase [Alkalihalophilus marmarensis]ERN52076.1 hypothetical protein A33I_18460 [Alkalihalophilus marmarensis DSM 21297]